MADNLLRGNFSWLSVFDAITTNDLQTLDHALSQGWDFRVPLKSTWNALEFAAATGRTKVLEFLASSEQMKRYSLQEQGRIMTRAAFEACMKKQEHSLNTILHYSVGMNLKETFDSLKVRDEMFEATYVGGSLNILQELETYYNRTELTPIHLRDYQLGRRELLSYDVSKFRQKHTDVQFLCPDGESRIKPIHVAAALNDVHLLRVLMKESPHDWYLIDDGTALGNVFQIATQYDNLKAVQLFFERIAIQKPAFFDFDTRVSKVCDTACRAGYLDIVEWIVENFPCHASFNSSWGKRMEESAANGHIDCLTYIYETLIHKQLQNSSVADVLRKEMVSTLHRVVRGGLPDLELVKYLMSLISIDWQNDSLLSRSIEGGSELLQLLLNAGAPLNCDSSGDERVLSYLHRFLDEVFSGRNGKKCLPPQTLEIIMNKMDGLTCKCGYVKPLKQFLSSQSSFSYDGDMPFDVIISHSTAVLTIFYKVGMRMDVNLVADSWEYILGDEGFIERIMAAKLIAVAEWIDLGELLLERNVSNMYGVLQCRAEAELDWEIMLRELFLNMCGTSMCRYTWDGFYEFLLQPPYENYKQLWNCVNQSGISIKDDESKAPDTSETSDDDGIHKAFLDVKRLGERTSMNGEVYFTGDMSPPRFLSLKALCRIHLHRQIVQLPGPKSARIQSLDCVLPRSVLDYLNFNDIRENWLVREKPGRFSFLNAQERNLLTGMIFNHFFREGIFGPDDDGTDYDDFDEYDFDDDDDDEFDEGEDEWLDEEEDVRFV